MAALGRGVCLGRLLFLPGRGCRPAPATASASELRFQVLIQTIVSLVITGICVGGFFTALGIKNSLSSNTGFIQNERQLVIYLFAVSALLILLVLLLLTSRRSYREIMPQEKVRAEIEKGIGTQFDPRFAGVMLEMIDADKDYSMRET